jgi:putative flippase GtrA
MTARTPATVSLPDGLRGTARQVLSFGAIGVLSTLAYVALYAALRNVASAEAANAAALLATAVGNTAANRRLTFDVRGRDNLARDHAAGLLALGAALAITSASLAGLSLVDPRHGRVAELIVLIAANALATLARYLLLRLAIERPRGGASGIQAGFSATIPEFAAPPERRSVPGKDA